MSTPDQRAQGVSWTLLLAVSGIFVTSLGLLHHNVLYTEGEVMQGLFALLIGLVAGCVLLGFRSRTVAVWCVTLLGGSLLLWQSYQSRQWALIHEEVVAIVRHAEDIRRETGQYPANLDGHVFKNVRVKSHIHGFGPEDSDGFRLTYFLNNPGITYWYSSKTGFGYFPD